MGFYGDNVLNSSTVEKTSVGLGNWKNITKNSYSLFQKESTEQAYYKYKYDNSQTYGRKHYGQKISTKMSEVFTAIIQHDLSEIDKIKIKRPERAKWKRLLLRDAVCKKQVYTGVVMFLWQRWEHERWLTAFTIISD